MRHVSMPRSHHHTRLLGCAALCVAVAACATPGQRRLHVLHTTDVHGQYEGLRRLASEVDDQRLRDRGLLVVDSGDMWSGTLVSDRNEGALGVALFNTIGYDAVALGNHEFDYGPIGPAREGGTDPFGALKARLAEASFPVLAANLVDRATGERPDWPNLAASVLVERGGYRVGIVGVITPQTPSITFPHVAEQLEFTDMSAAVAREALALRQQGADLVIALAHAGGNCREMSDPSDLSTCEGNEELFHLVRGLPGGLVDAVFGGHTHRFVRHRLNGVAMLQAGAHADRVAELDVADGERGRRVTLLKPRKLPVGQADSLTRDRVDKLLRPAEARAAGLRAELLGARAVRPITRNRTSQSALGTLVCDVLLDRHRAASICLINSGGLRHDLPAGPITYGALYDTLPFGNHPALVEVSGAVLLELLRVGTSGAHGVVQVAGLRIAYDAGADPCPQVDRSGDGSIGSEDRARLTSATLADGSAIDPQAMYTIVTNSFLARGGDNWSQALSSLPNGAIRVLADGLPVREELAEWLRRTRPILNSPDRPLLDAGRVEARGVAPLGACAGPMPDDTRPSRMK